MQVEKSKVRKPNMGWALGSKSFQLRLRTPHLPEMTSHCFSVHVESVWGGVGDVLLQTYTPHTL